MKKPSKPSKPKLVPPPERNLGRIDIVRLLRRSPTAVDIAILTLCTIGIICGVILLAAQFGYIH